MWSLTSSTLLRFSETASFTVYGVGQWHSFEVGVAPAGGSISWSTTCLLITNYSQPPLQPWSSSLYREARAKEKNTSSCQVPTTPHYKVLINRHLRRWVKVLIWSWPQFINLNDVGALVKRLLDQLSDGTPLPCFPSLSLPLRLSPLFHLSQPHVTLSVPAAVSSPRSLCNRQGEGERERERDGEGVKQAINKSICFAPLS